MRVFSEIDGALAKGTYVATIGFFDGVHLGHQYLLKTLSDYASNLGMQSMVISFETHPKNVLPGDYNPALLTSKSEKIKYLDALGLDACYLIDFTKSLSQLTAFDFMKEILVERLGVGTLFIGYDHRFGRNREAGFDDYVRYGQELGLKVIQADAFMHEVEHISSSVIRKYLLEGNISAATHMLGYNYPLQGKVEGGKRLGHSIRFPTANICPNDINKLIPAPGVYAVYVDVKGNRYKGMLNIGFRPTIEANGFQTVEVHILDFNQDIYGEMLTIIFLEKIRDELKFASIDELKIQLQKDKEYVLSTIID